MTIPPLSTDLQKIADKITASASNGSVPKFKYSELLAAAAFQDARVINVHIPLNLSLDSFDQVSGVFGGASLSTIVPRGILPDAQLTLLSVDFMLTDPSDPSTTPGEVFQMSCAIGFMEEASGSSTGTTPLTWQIADIDSHALEVTLDYIGFTKSMPGQAMSIFQATVYGSVEVGTGANSVTLDVTAGFPNPYIKLDLAKGCSLNLGSFFDHFGLPKAAFLADLSLSQFDFCASPGSGSFDLNAAIEATGALSLLPSGSPVEISLDRMGFDFSHAPGSSQGFIGARLLCRAGNAASSLAVGVRAYVDITTGNWTFTGNIDVPETCLTLGKPPVGGIYTVTLKDLATIFAPSYVNDVPSEIAGLGISTLFIDYTHVKGGANNTYEFYGVFDDQWSLGGSSEIKTELGITLSNSQNQVSADFEMHGFEFTLAYAFGSSSTINASISAMLDGQALNLSGSYSANPPNEDGKPAGGTATLNFGDGVNLGMLLAWFIGEVTKNRYFKLPPPWDDVFKRIEIPSGTSLSIDTGTKTVSFNYAPSGGYTLPFDISLSSVTLGYAPPAAGGGSGISVDFSASVAGSAKTFSWDPATEQPPELPGHAPLISIKMAAAGQHIAFSGDAPPASVRTAVDDLATALTGMSAGSLKPNTMAFNRANALKHSAKQNISEEVIVQYGSIAQFFGAKL